MPQPTPEEQDALEEAIDWQLYKKNKVMRGIFGTEMTDDEQRRAYHRIKQGVTQAQRQQEAQRRGLPEGITLPPGTSLEDFAEGGLVNDASGQGTAKVRRQMGV